MQRQLRMTVAGGLVKHLGLQMYSGAVPALAELVSNAWDAMATEVRVVIPTDRPLEHNDHIEVIDNGTGMSFEECQERYLRIGLDRRRLDGDTTKAFNGIQPRRLMSRKGIGKLAGFGIANRMEVRTVKSGSVTHFALDFDAIQRSEEDLQTYNVEILKEDNTTSAEPDGTKIALRQLKLSRAVPADLFSKSLAKRFSILSDPNFSVKLNDHPITKDELDFEFRIPSSTGSFVTENVAGVGTVKYWFGFTAQPIKDELARGITVFSRGKLAQSPWYFELASGGNQSYGLQYLTGEIESESIDKSDGVDLIATDRATVRWDEPPADLLRNWAQEKLKFALQDWLKRRVEKKTNKPIVTKYLSLASRLPTRQRETYLKFVNALTHIPSLDDEGLLGDLITFGYNAITNQGILEVVRQLNGASDAEVRDFDKAMSEWNILEAVQMAQIIRGRLEVIKALERFIQTGAREKPELHNLVRDNTWLIDLGYDRLESETTLENLLSRQFGIQIEDNEGNRRIDFFCKSDASRNVIVEIKRADFKATKKSDLQQISDYTDFVHRHNRSNNVPGLKRDTVIGHMIVGEIDPSLDREVERLEGGKIYVRTWDGVLSETMKRHQHFYNVMKSRAPNEDPRISELDEASSVEENNSEIPERLQIDGDFVG